MAHVPGSVAPAAERFCDIEVELTQAGLERVVVAFELRGWRVLSMTVSDEHDDLSVWRLLLSRTS